MKVGSVSMLGLVLSLVSLLGRRALWPSLAKVAKRKHVFNFQDSFVHQVSHTAKQRHALSFRKRKGQKFWKICDWAMGYQRHQTPCRVWNLVLVKLGFQHTQD